ncbi:Hsp20/alpha crystallin family protein [Halomarina ordinaria]|uniref:Hsp20/alpha crystallin family protein n=1 Tax=Halomarina ordinaria TaxID=3033939 RepID=A0ABD5U701_9EURY|nr:Hsp20/alpha crystallin family protein [Halomarina sp. PSRA2]
MSALRDALQDLPDAVFADLLESDDAYLVVVDLPGATADTVDARVDEGTLRLEVQRAKDLPDEFRYLSEDRSLFLDAELRLPPDATGNGAEATIERGVLELTLPKTSAAPDEPIPVRDG